MNIGIGNRIQQQTGNVLFVADLTEETCEEDLIGLFKDYHLTVCKVMNRITKAFALVHFENPEWAEKARNDLNGMKLQPKYSTSAIAKPIRICRWETKQSIRDRGEDDYKKNLLVKNLNKDLSAHILWSTFRKYGDIRSCKLTIDFQGNSKGFGYITYYNVIDAENAKNELGGKEIMGKELIIDYLQPGLKKNIKKNNVYVKHFPRENFSQEDLRKIFAPFGNLVSIMIAPDLTNTELNRGFGFVCFENADNAEKAQRELNGKSFWSNLLPLYVNFAMRKEERLEHLQRQKEEQMRNSYKTTIFCKIKEGVNITNNNDFVSSIMRYFATLFGENYTPKSIKPRIETKNAFITVNSAIEVESFMKFFNEISKTQPSGLYFNQYKSKVERMNSNNVLKRKYNDFENPQNILGIPGVNQVGKMGIFKSYNDFGTQPLPQPQMGGYYGADPLMNQMRYQNYNNFNDFPSDPHQNLLQQFNNIQPQVMPIQRPPIFPQKSKEELEEEEKVDILDRIYHDVFQVHPEDAPKITGMLAELALPELKDLISSQHKLQSVINSAYAQLHS